MSFFRHVRPHAIRQEDMDGGMKGFCLSDTTQRLSRNSCQRFTFTGVCMCATSLCSRFDLYDLSLHPAALQVKRRSNKNIDEELRKKDCLGTRHKSTLPFRAQDGFFRALSRLHTCPTFPLFILAGRTCNTIILTPSYDSCSISTVSQPLPAHQNVQLGRKQRDLHHVGEYPTTHPLQPRSRNTDEGTKSKSVERVQSSNGSLCRMFAYPHNFDALEL